MFNKKKKEKDLPLIARVNLAEEMKKRQENMQLGDVSILARADYTKRFPRIRLMYVRFEKFSLSKNRFLLYAFLFIHWKYVRIGIENA